MTTKQKQWQLYFLGFYGSSIDDIDGIWGPKSSAATREFQKSVGILVDGIFGTNTEAKAKGIIDSIQNAVTKYADTPLVNDGLAGPATMAAIAKYQAAIGLPITNIADAATRATIRINVASTPQVTPNDNWWDEIECFNENEFACNCGGQYCNGFPSRMKKDVVVIANNARKHFGSPAHVVSGLRCQQWNAIQGGVYNSQHMYGEAIDLQIDGVSADRLLAFVKQQPNLRYAYKINLTNVHFDIPKGAR